MADWQTARMKELEEERLVGWHSVASSPADVPLQLCVIDPQGIHVLRFPCRRTPLGWVNAVTDSQVLFRATHWREWTKAEISTAAETSARVRVNQLLIGAELPTLYDEFLRQPIPEELAKLLDELAEREIDQLGSGSAAD
jgi:hypothetical protein